MSTSYCLATRAVIANSITRIRCNALFTLIFLTPYTYIHAREYLVFSILTRIVPDDNIDNANALKKSFLRANLLNYALILSIGIEIIIMLICHQDLLKKDNGAET